MYNVSDTLAKVLAGIVGTLLVIITTFAFAGKMPPAGTGKMIPPELFAKLAELIKAAFVQLKLVKALLGQATVAANKFSGLLPT